MDDMLQKCAKNDQVQNNPTLKWGTCHNGKYVVASKINCYFKQLLRGVLHSWWFIFK
jgi:hypothetical protein